MRRRPCAEKVVQTHMNFVPVPGHWGTLPLTMMGHQMGQQRRTYTDEYMGAAVERLYEPGSIQGLAAKELGITGTQLQTWRLEIEAFGSAEANKSQCAVCRQTDWPVR